MPKKKRSKKKKIRYNKPFYKIMPTAIFGLAGLFYLVVPYNIIVGTGLGFGETHEGHLIFGAVFLAMAAAIWLINGRRKK